MASFISFARPLSPFVNEGLIWTLWNIVTLKSSRMYWGYIQSQMCWLSPNGPVNMWQFHRAVFWSHCVLHICSRSPTPVPHRAVMGRVSLAAQWRSMYVPLSLAVHVKVMCNWWPNHSSLIDSSLQIVSLFISPCLCSDLCLPQLLLTLVRWWSHPVCPDIKSMFVFIVSGAFIKDTSLNEMQYL